MFAFPALWIGDEIEMLLSNLIMTSFPTVEEVVLTPDNSPLKTIVGQNAHFFVSISSRTNVPWKEVAWYRLNSECGLSRECVSDFSEIPRSSAFYDSFPGQILLNLLFASS